ncbi:MAG TPA: PAS domain S-box protein [Candidatus Methylacidiphilales bacterium]|jgi:PAS domain S-box-containing protein|nr:PAS domain S-box protein [Candidatus Methylacidiphilales bacterium]
MFSLRRTSLANVLLPILLADAVVLAFCAALYFGLAAPIKSNNLETEGRRLDIYKNIVDSDVDGAIGDLRLLASGDGITDYLDTANPADLQRAVNRAVFVSKDNPDYDQVRYLDENGHEVFRVNWNGAVVPSSQLQDKAGRPYFQKANALAPGQIYLSPIELNVENGVIEWPLKPTLRLAVPVFDTQGRHRGVYIINYRAANIIGQLRSYVPRRAQRLRLLNSQGYWLAGASPAEEWGFDLPEHAAANLARTDPELWAQVQAEPTGQVRFHGGYFTWDRIPPKSLAAGKPVQIIGDDDYIVIASVITPQEWADTLLSLRQSFVVVAALLVVLATFTTRVFQSRRQAQIERDRFFNLSRDMLCIAGADGYFKRVNPAWAATLGYSVRDLTSQPFLTFVHPDDREKTTAEAARLARGGETVNFENRYRCKDGTYRWLLWSARSVPGDDVIYASARDTTERRQIEEKLRLSEERLRLMVDSLREYAVIMLSPEGKVMSWNAGAERTHGYAAAEIVGQHFSRFYLADKIAEKFPDLELKLAVENGRFEDEGWRLRKDGSCFWANVVISPMRNSQGELVGYVKVTRDVTARKEAAERIENLNHELKSRADLLESANKELESFSYSVSHDLRAPLRHIHGFVELLQKSPLFNGQESAQRHMGVIAKAAREMGMLIDDLLAFSRTGRAEMQVTSVNMRDLVDQCIHGLAADIADRKIAWTIAPLATVDGDPALLRLVWTNLLGNAVKYTRPRDDVHIEIGQEERCDVNGRPQDIVYFVRDNGVGFDMRYASKLFGVFQRLHRADDFEGTGIGLANVQRIIHRHGGKVWAVSQLDAGATFYFSLPIKSPHATPTYVNGQV